MCEAAVAWALYLQTVASFGRMTGNPYLADLGRFADQPPIYEWSLHQLAIYEWSLHSVTLKRCGEFYTLFEDALCQSPRARWC
jgi:hypothetical protein